MSKGIGVDNGVGMDNRRMNDQRLEGIERLLDKIFGILDGPKGVVTKIELHSQQLKDIPSPTNLKWYAFIGGGITVFFGLIGYSVVRMLKGE